MTDTSWRADRRSSTERGYDARWRKARAAFLARPENVCCAMCAEEGRTTLATVVDHKIPHRGDPALFWDRSGWQALCKPHHDGAKQAEEKSGRKRKVVGPDGWPVELP